MAKWSLSTYNKFTGRAMTKYGLTRKQAAQMYREVRAKEGKPVFSSYIKKHPTISRKAADTAISRRPPVEKPAPSSYRAPVSGIFAGYEPEDFEDLDLDLDQEAESSYDY